MHVVLHRPKSTHPPLDARPEKQAAGRDMHGGVPLPTPSNLHVAETTDTAAPPHDLPALGTRPPLVRPAGREGARPTVQPLGPAWYPACKQAVDFVLALALLVPAAPLVALAALLTRLTSGGPAF